MGLNKFCCRCDAIISHRDKYCKECQEPKLSDFTNSLQFIDNPMTLV